MSERNHEKGRSSRREKRRFEDDESNGRFKEEEVQVKKDEEGGGGRDGGDYSNSDRKKRARRRFEDGESVAEPSNRSGSRPNDGAEESLNVSSRFPSESFSANNHTATKVSSISTTNENKGVNITGSHEVTGKSSTDGTPSTAGKSGNISLDALAKAKKALQMQKELAEKWKKIPLSNKGTSSTNVVSSQGGSKEENKFSNAAGIQRTPPNIPPAASSAKTVGMIDPAKYEAVKRAQELAAKMGFRQDTEFAPLINLFPGQLPPDAAALQKPAKAPVLRLDAFGREIDEHGNVVNISKPSSLSTLKVNINKQKKDAFQIHKPELEVDPEKNPHFDPRMGIDKTKLLRPKRMSFQFVEEGKWSKDAEIIKLKSQFGEAQAKEHKAKQAQLAKAKAEPNINPNLIEVSERVITKEKPKESIPEVEWWDVPLLRSGDYADIADGSTIEDRVKMEKITMYVEHPRPIEPPAEPAPPQPQPLKLTKKEQKKLRTQRRLAKEKERQEMIRQGLIEPPKPKVKMSNLMKVLGSEATQDPTKLEMEIRTAAAEREQAHVDRNIARKLTPAERREKKERKLFDDPNTLETIVSVYKINDLSHPKNRFKVDINAQENRLTGCAVISEGFSVVVVEGGSKSIKRYGKLMLRRIDWAAKLENEDEEEDDDEEKPPNKCVLVWQGSVAKPCFNRFFIHDCRTEAAARKVFFDAGVGHYWELAANFVDDQI
ncbi:protein RDM16-like isoform X1 [Chenopodium quinoa]|uniref:protein RDM16-like isoform X1 n=2 Tax=Chenopodium quinoa TaxID=63459 RepID=UPI000B795F85|nr:protein RDM16-like isoform X1 [Chenopodium quinoa]